VLVSVGPAVSGEELPEAATLGRQQLAEQGRLFDLNLSFMDVNPLVDDLFRSARYVILPNRNWYGISASLFQSASYGCPVLVPDIGSVGTTVRRYDIGLTYRHLDLKHLRHQFAELRRDPTRFSDRALHFSRRVDDKAVFAALAAAFGAEWRDGEL
jgi:glycosyltransferase involved in cell wall biosynthesis